MERYIEDERSANDDMRNPAGDRELYHIEGDETLVSACGRELFADRYGRILLNNPQETGEGKLCDKCKQVVEQEAS